MPRRRPIAEEPRFQSLRVAKTLGPEQPGAKRQALKHGDSLVCVRHRIDGVTNQRYVTVELVVDVVPIQSRDNKEVAVRIDPTDRSARVLLLSCGAQWDGPSRVWRMPRSVARSLRLLRQIVPNAQ